MLSHIYTLTESKYKKYKNILIKIHIYVKKIIYIFKKTVFLIFFTYHNFQLTESYLLILQKKRYLVSMNCNSITEKIFVDN